MIYLNGLDKLEPILQLAEPNISLLLVRGYIFSEKPRGFIHITTWRWVR